MANSIGRPRVYSDAQDLEVKVDEYLNSIPKSKWTITGLALYLGFESRQSFYDYEENGGFSYIIKRARLFIESSYEEKLSGNSPTGPIFALKNMGWKDKTEVDTTIRAEAPQSIVINGKEWQPE